MQKILDKTILHNIKGSWNIQFWPSYKQSRFKKTTTFG